MGYVSTKKKGNDKGAMLFYKKYFRYEYRYPRNVNKMRLLNLSISVNILTGEQFELNSNINRRVLHNGNLNVKRNAFIFFLCFLYLRELFTHIETFPFVGKC